MLRSLFRLGVLSWLATQAYKRVNQPMVDPSAIKKHMEVLGSDNIHVGMVDHLAIKLTKSDPGAHGMHHIIPIDNVASTAGGKLVLNITAAEAAQKQQAVTSQPSDKESVLVLPPYGNAQPDQSTEIIR